VALPALSDSALPDDATPSTRGLLPRVSPARTAAYETAIIARLRRRSTSLVPQFNISSQPSSMYALGLQPLVGCCRAAPVAASRVGPARATTALQRCRPAL
jgi:hypothetical protein